MDEGHTGAAKRRSATAQAAGQGPRAWPWLAGTVVGLTAVGLLLGAALAAYGVMALPRLDGQAGVAGLRQPVQVRRDMADVTQIRASSPQDVWRALGYVHAQERGWQLEFNRRVMHGSLSEILGPGTLETDKLMRALDIRGAAQRQYAALPALAREALQAYSDGIAAFHHSGQPLPPEFQLLDTRPGGGQEAPWTPQDSVGWTLMMALDLGGNWGNEFARLSLLSTLSTEQLWQLMPAYPGEAPATATDLAALYRGLGVYRRGTLAQAPASQPSLAQAPVTGSLDWAQALADQAGTPDGSNDGKGSNNWVLSGERSRSGKPLLANDPHLGLSAPALWYYAHLQAPAGEAADGTPLAAIDAIGATLPGLPFVVLGRTAEVAWGFTNTNPDVQDLYLEQIDAQDPGRYRTPEGWARFVGRTETIKVKGQADVQLRLRSTRHGPVLSDVQASHAEVIDTSRYVLALRWAALETDNRTVLAGLRSNEARSVAQLFEAFADYHSPMQSIVAADIHGAIGFKAAGKSPLRARDNDLRGIAPAPGWDARYDWTGWLAYADTPEDNGQDRGFIATANQRVTPQGYAHFLTQDWHLPYRHQRIEQLIEAQDLHDRDSMAAVQNDVLSLATLALLPAIREAPARHALAGRAQALLQDFDARMDQQRAAPLIFAAWVDELARGIVLPRIGLARFSATYGRRDYRAGLEGILARNDAWWCAPLSCAEQSGRALDRALQRLEKAYGSDIGQWRWGQAHPALSTHRPLGSVALLARFFDVRVASSGDAYTVNVGQYNPGDSRAPFTNRHAPSLRAIYDLGDPEQSLFIYQTGQSGLVFSERYHDMRDEWAQGRYRLLQREPAQWRHQQLLLPVAGVPAASVSAP